MKKSICILMSVIFMFILPLTSCKPKHKVDKGDNSSKKPGITEPLEPELSENNESSQLDDTDDFDGFSNFDDFEMDVDNDDLDYSEEQLEEMIYIDSHSIVYSKSASDRQKNMIAETASKLNDKYNMGIIYDDSEENSGVPELLIGNTNRKASQKAMSLLTDNRKNNANDYIIMVDGEDVVINATSDYALKEAIDYFLKKYCKGTLPTVPNDLNIFYKPDIKAANHQISGTDINSYVIVTPRDKSTIYLWEIEDLVNLIRKATGYEIPVVDDRANEQNYEILVGNTNRAQSNGSLLENQYILEQKDKKIVMRGGHTYSTAAAVQKFKNLVDNSIKSTGTVNVASNLKLSGTYAQKENCYNLVWFDEFNGTTLDTDKWERTVEVTDAWDGGKCYRTDSLNNSRVENGTLILQGNKNGESSYDSAKLRTNDSMNYLYGYLEIRARLPEGKGIWPGFWLNAQGLSNPAGMPEVDVFEMFGTSNRIESALHKWWTENNMSMHISVSKFLTFDRGYTLSGNETFHDNYHTFGFEWTPEYMKFYVDGYNYASFNISEEDMEIFHHPMYVILSMAIGLMNIAPPDETTDWNKVLYYIDWIHLYQIPGVGKLNLR